jgi:hypothetical protein
MVSSENIIWMVIFCKMLMKVANPPMTMNIQASTLINRDLFSLVLVLFSMAVSVFMVVAVSVFIPGYIY